MMTVVSGVLGLFLGVQVDRRGPRPLMLAGAFVAGGALVATSFVQTFWQFILLRGVAQTTGIALVGQLVVNTTVAKWFILRRGSAISITSMGVPLGGILIAPLTSSWIGMWGWREAWAALGVLTFVAAIPAALIMRRQPEDYGMRPDGLSPEQAAIVAAGTRRATASSERSWTRPEATRTPALWLVIAGYGMASLGQVALTVHGVPLLQDSGFSASTATLLVTSVSWASFGAKFFWGPLADRVPVRFLSCAGFLALAASLVVLIPAAKTGDSLPVLATLIALGVATGGNAPLQELVWASYFGRGHLGSVRGLSMPFSVIFGAGGPLLAARLFDSTGSYEVAILVFAACAVAGAGLIFLARPPR
jgi:sugar phosphate permease